MAANDIQGVELEETPAHPTEGLWGCMFISLPGNDQSKSTYNHISAARIDAQARPEDVRVV